MTSERTFHRVPIRQTALALISELGSESNAHGVARIVRSRDNRRKVLWSLLVLLGVGAAISQLSSLVHKYLQYQVVEVSEIQDGHPVEFPSVTVCNIEPISWRKLRMLMSSEPGSSDILGWLHFLEEFQFGRQAHHLRSIRAFHENVGRDALLVRHSLNESLLHCSFNKEPCSIHNFTTSFDGNYYSCFTFNTQPTDPSNRLIVHSTGPEYGLSLIMFLDNNEPPLGTYGVYTLDSSILHSAGARVMVHAPNTMPVPVDHGQDVAPGFSTSISIKPYLHARLPQPYGNCSDTSLRGLPSFTSTFSTCLAVCKQELIVSRCKCRSSALPELTSLRHVPYCGQVPDWRELLSTRSRYSNRSLHLQALDCEEEIMERLKNDRSYEMDCGCTHPCGELSYRLSTSMSYWPLELYQFDALQKLFGATGILNSPLSRAYKLHDQNIREGLQQIIRAQEQREQAGGGPHPGDTSSSPTTAQGGDDSTSVIYAAVDGEGEHPRTAAGNETAENDPAHASEGKGRGESEEPASYPTLEYNRQQLDNLREASTEIRQNLLRLNVYLEDLSVVKFKQMPAYGMEDLFADIGGTLGLWMGVSVLTMVELLELAVRLGYLCLRAEWKPDQEAAESAVKAPGQDGTGEGAAQGEGRCVRDDVRASAAQSDVTNNDENAYYSPSLRPQEHAVDMYGRGIEHSRPGYTAAYSGNTKYWRLKRGKKR